MKRERKFNCAVTFKNVKFDFTQLHKETEVGLINTGFDAYEFTFTPPVAEQFKLKVSDLVSKTSDCVLKIPNWQECNMIQEAFVETATYVCKVNKERAVVGLYLKLENVQMNGNIETPIWHPRFRLGLFLADKLLDTSRRLGADSLSEKGRMGGTGGTGGMGGMGGMGEKGGMGETSSRYTPLHFTPLSSSELDLSLIPQDNPIPLKPNGGMTGSKIAKCIGYYPGPETAFTGWKAVAVTFGRLNEFMVLMQYLKHHPDYSAKEIGWVGLRPDSNDGCQPDAIIFDRDRNAWPLEIKCSKSNCSFEGSHIVQCVWEMACNKSPYMDLVKYCEKSINTQGNTWKKQRECREIRIYRSEELEQELLKREKSPELMKKFDLLADECNQRAIVIPVDDSIIEAIQVYKNLHIKEEEEAKEEEDGFLDRMEKRQTRIYNHFQENQKDQLINEIFDQVNDYGELIRKLE